MYGVEFQRRKDVQDPDVWRMWRLRHEKKVRQSEVMVRRALLLTLFLDSHSATASFISVPTTLDANAHHVDVEVPEVAPSNNQLDGFIAAID